MYFDYAVLALMVWGLADTFLLPGKISDDSDDSWPPVDPAEEQTLTDGSLYLDELVDDSIQSVIPPDPDVAEDYLYVGGTTTVTVETEGEVTTTSFEDVDFGIAPTVFATDFGDIVTASDETGLELNIDAGDGDDTVNFGYGASVDGGEGSDILLLSVTQNALASENDVGQIEFTDTTDTLSVDFENETPEFVHTVRGQTTVVADGVSTQTDWIDYYVSENATLSEDALSTEGYIAPTEATRVFRAILGTGTPGATAVNDDPAIQVNRTIATTTDLTT
mgnify:CR=1 FL=1